ncbi:MAG TPA: Ig domain-containing protein [Pilimelia sp.]|nr:Ig domain-containing protein [Pilimelia sp.]
MLRRNDRCAAGPHRAAGDAGFTLAEVIVSVALVATVMAALGMFFVRSVAVTGEQRVKQVAVQLTDTGLEYARALKGSQVAAGRGQNAVREQWRTAPDRLRQRLPLTQLAEDPAAATNAGATGCTPLLQPPVCASLPTVAQTVPVNGLGYQRHWYIGECRQAVRGGLGGVAGASVPCTDAPTGVRFYRVLVAVTWPAAACAGGACSHVGETLISAEITEPAFNPADAARAPVAEAVANQQHYVGDTVTDVVLRATAGTTPLSWIVTGPAGLPAGLTMRSGNRIGGTIDPGAAAGTYQLTATVTDAYGLEDSVDFTWVVHALPAVVPVPDQVTTFDTLVYLPLSLTGGVGPYTWTVTGLPPGMSLNATTGLVSGAPTTVAPARPVTVTVRDTNGRSASDTFLWRISPLQITIETLSITRKLGSGGPPADLGATGGQEPYEFEVEDLPDGMQVDKHGRFKGNPQEASRFVTTASVTDSTGAVDRVFLTIVVESTSGLRVTTGPADRTTDRVGATVALQPVAAGGAGYTWTAAGLPAGVSMTPGGAISGRLQTPRVPTPVRLTVTDNAGNTAVYMFVWGVRP